eukprot:GHVN01043811.1.p1 GENE.GHVN01043811.1~~GHVN01043811.1.p1  ORF type:complete len:203 (+),score=13.49 GHVN01043811.1:982-1590(+)
MIPYRAGKENVLADFLSRNAAGHEETERATARVAIPLCEITKKELQNRLEIDFPYREVFEEEPANMSVAEARGLRLDWRENLWVTKTGRLFVPPTLREQVVAFAHLKGAHQGANRTTAFLRRLLWWPSMKEDINLFLKQCWLCTRWRHKPLTLTDGSLEAKSPREVVAVDLVGPFYSGAKAVHVWTMLDQFTRCARLLSVRG